MTDSTENFVHEYFRQLRDAIAAMRNENKTFQAAFIERMERLEIRMGSVEGHIASLRQDIALLHGDFAGQSVRLDQFERRFDRIEKRLELQD